MINKGLVFIFLVVVLERLVICKECCKVLGVFSVSFWSNGLFRFDSFIKVSGEVKKLKICFSKGIKGKVSKVKIMLKNS